MKRLKTLGLTLAPLLVAGSAFAEGETDGAAIITSLGSSVSGLAAAGFTLLGIILAGTIGMKLVKKFSNRAT